MPKLSRRRFLQATAAADAVTSLAAPLTFAQRTAEPDPFVWPQNGTLIPDEGWRLWLFQRCPDFHPALQQRFQANALAWLTGPEQHAS